MNAKRLKHMIAHAYDTVPFYNNIYDDCQLDITNLNLPEDLEKLPIVSKDDICQFGWSNFIAQQYLDDDYEFIKSSKLRIERTSGTTQKKMDIPWLQKDYYSSIINHWRYRQQFGITTSSRKLDNYRYARSEFPYFIDLPANKMTVNNYALSFENILRILDNIYLYEPEWLYIQPSLLYVLVNIAKAEHKPFPKSIRYIEYIGEPLLDYYRATIEDYIQVNTSDMYGCTETNGIAYECLEGNLHLLESNTITEVIDKNENSVMDTIGNVCVTGLYNTAMPMIRYKLNDEALLHRSEECICGSKSPVLELMITRLPEFLIFGVYSDKNEDMLIYPVNKLNIMKPGKMDILFHMKLMNLKTYTITFINHNEYKLHDDFESIFKCIFIKHGLSNINFVYSYQEQINPQESIGILRLNSREK